MKQKILFFAILLLICLPLLSACGNNSGTAPSQKDNASVKSSDSQTSPGGQESHRPPSDHPKDDKAASAGTDNRTNDAGQGLYVIVDWHILSDSNPNTYLAEAKEFFREISSEYSEADHILYEICNEPNGNTGWADIKSYALEVIPVIRANDPDVVIIIGTPNWCQYVDQAAADPITEYGNLMYSLHFYAATHKEELRSQMAAAISRGLPIFVTEYGICDASGSGGLDLDQASQWVAAMDEYGVSHVAWNLSNKNESSAILKSSCSKTSGFTQEDLSDSGLWLYRMLADH